MQITAQILSFFSGKICRNTVLGFCRTKGIPKKGSPTEICTRGLLTYIFGPSDFLLKLRPSSFPRTKCPRATSCAGSGGEHSKGAPRCARRAEQERGARAGASVRRIRTSARPARSHPFCGRSMTFPRLSARQACRFLPRWTTISRSPSAARRSSPSCARPPRPSSRCATSLQVARSVLSCTARAVFFPGVPGSRRCGAQSARTMRACEAGEHCAWLHR